MKPTRHNVNDLYARAYGHHAKGDFGLAMKKYQEILSVFPDHKACLHNVLRLHMAVNNLSEALDYSNRLVRLDSNDWEALLYRADVYRLQHKTELALEDAHTSISIKESALAHNTLALVYRDLEQWDLANSAWQRCVEIDPEGKARWAFNLAQSQLLQRDYATGFRLYEGRRQAGVGQQRPQANNKPAWTGLTKCEGKRMVLHWEQGIGDTIQMLRYAHVFKQMGAEHITVVVQDELFTLAQGIPGVDLVLTDKEPWPLWDLHVSLMSCPRAAGTLFQTIPWTGTYIRHKDEPIKPLEGTPKSIGFVWSGSVKLFAEEMWMRPPKSRDVPQEEFLAWTERVREALPSARLVSLQVGRPVKDTVLELPELTSWDVTASLIEELDLVITVDTAVAHLAGTMGKPVWLLNRKAPDWRWHLDMNTSPWYPSVRIYRQTEFNVWADVLDHVLKDLVDGKA